DSVSPKDIFVNYATANVTAAAGVDYVATSGTLKISAGQTSGTIAVAMIGSNVQHPDRTFFVNISNPTFGATIVRSQATATIINGKGPNIAVAPATISVGDMTVQQPSSGTSTASFPVYLDTPLPFDVIVL